MVPMGRDRRIDTGLPMARDPLRYVHGIPVVQMGRDGHSGLPIVLDHWDMSMGSQHTPWYRWVGMDTVDYQWYGIPGIYPWDPSIHHGTDG